VPYIIGGAVFSLFPLLLEHHPIQAFMVLSLAITGAYCGGAPTLALVTATVSGPAVAIALPFFNSVRSCCSLACLRLLPACACCLPAVHPAPALQPGLLESLSQRWPLACRRWATWAASWGRTWWAGSSSAPAATAWPL
jgi:hypothetical protein